MKTHSWALAAALCAGLTLTAHAKIERVVEKSFTVQPGGVLTVETQGGNIRVETSNEPMVKVVAKETIRASSDEEAAAILKDLSLTIEQTSEGVSAISKYEKSFSGLHFGSWPPVQVSFVVSIPTEYNVKAKTSGGDVSVGNLLGKVNARTSGGNISLGKISGDVDAGTSGGDVRLDEGRARVKLNTSGGNIAVNHAVGPTNVDTSGGDIKIDLVENTLDASTSGGNVSAGFIGTPKGDCVLHTSGGTVRATVDKFAAFRLDASTSGGSVDANGLTITLEKGGSGKSHLVGTVNGGGPTLKLRTSGGDIRVSVR
jgi:hypothetical protein